MNQFDYTQCTHIFIRKGYTRRGTPRIGCIVCKRTYSIGILTREDRLRIIGQCYTKNYSQAECTRITGINKNTVNKYYKILSNYKHLPCLCGLPINHIGFCNKRKEVRNERRSRAIGNSSPGN